MIKNLLSDSLKYGLGKAVTKFFPILIVPIIAKTFPPEIFGEINIITVFVGLFFGISALGLDAAMGFFYFHGEEDLKRDYLGTALIARLLMSIFVFAGFILFARVLSGADFMLKSNERYLLIILGAAVIPFDNCMVFFINLTRYLMKPLIFNIENFSKVIIYYILISIFLIGDFTIENVLTAIIISSAIPAFLLFLFYRKHLKYKINFYCLKRLLRYGLPMVPASIMFFFMSSMGRFVLNAYTTLEETGIYSMMTFVAGIFLFFTNSILIAWPPYSMLIAKRHDAQAIFARITTLLLIFLIPLAFLFWSVSDIMILIFSTPIYLRGEKAVILIILQHILNLIYYCAAIGLTLKEKTIYITIGYSIAAIVAVLISFPLCMYLGIFGAALSSCIGYLISTVYIAYKSQQFYFIPYNIKFLFIYSISFLTVLILLLSLPGTNMVFNFIVRFVVGCIFLVIPFASKNISLAEIKNMLFTKTKKIETPNIVD